MLKIFIAEDEIKTLNSIKKMIETYCADTYIAGSAQSVKESVEFLSKHTIDLVLFDIDFPDGTGFDILKQLNNYNFQIIFITAHEKYAVQAIKLSAVDYLVKPVNPKELIAAVHKGQYEIESKHTDLLKIETLLSNINTPKKTFEKIIIKTSERIIVLDIKDIIRCESDNSYTSFYLSDKKKILSSKVLKEYDDMLCKSGFIRTHKSHLINLNFIKSFEKAGGGYLVLKDYTKIPVSVRKRESVLNALDNFS